MIETIGIIAASVLLGLVVGVLAGMLGVGGGTVYLPVFRVLFGLSAVSTTATSLFTIIPTSISGAVTHMRNKTCVPKLGLAMGVGGALTSTIGVRLAQISPGWMIMVAAAIAIVYSSITMFRKALAAPKASNTEEAARSDSAKSRAQAPRRDGVPSAPDFTGKQFAMGLIIGAVAGVASGYIGLGGGFLMVPLMISLLDMPMKLTSGTSLIAIMILAIPATIAQCMLGNVDYLIGIAISCGAIPGAFVGAKLTRRLPERALRFAFSGLLVFGAIMLVVKELGLLA